MSHNQDVFRVGRGGAGNFHSKPTASDNANKDLEAQKPDPSIQPAPASGEHLPGQYARAGRGGAGNFFEPSVAKEQQSTEEEITAKANANAGKVTNRLALGGRGGAGNYHQKQEEGEDKEAEKQRVQHIEKQAADEVDGELKMPEKAMLAQDRQ